MYLSSNFQLSDFTFDPLAVQLRISNEPSPEHVNALRALCIGVLEPLRNLVGTDIVIVAGYRCPRLQRLYKDAKDTQHGLGEAVDLRVKRFSNQRLIEVIASHIEFDRLIPEYMDPANPTDGWVHVSYREGANRKQYLWKDNKE